jgi:hypothetical protein
MVARTFNPSYLGRRDLEDHSPRSQGGRESGVLPEK